MPKHIDVDSLRFPNICIFDMTLHGETVPMVKLVDLQKLVPAADVVEQPRWIPVTERSPEDGSDVLAYLDSRITAANYYKETWQDCVMGRLYLTEEGFVTHWMPLPEPPKEET